MNCIACVSGGFFFCASQCKSYSRWTENATENYRGEGSEKQRFLCLPFPSGPSPLYLAPFSAQSLLKRQSKKSRFFPQWRIRLISLCLVHVLATRFCSTVLQLWPLYPDTSVPILQWHQKFDKWSTTKKTSYNNLKHYFISLHAIFWTFTGKIPKALTLWLSTDWLLLKLLWILCS